MWSFAYLRERYGVPGLDVPAHSVVGAEGQDPGAAAGPNAAAVQRVRRCAQAHHGSVDGAQDHRFHRLTKLLSEALREKRRYVTWGKNWNVTRGWKCQRLCSQNWDWCSNLESRIFIDGEKTVCRAYKQVVLSLPKKTKQ